MNQIGKGSNLQTYWEANPINTLSNLRYPKKFGDQFLINYVANTLMGIVVMILFTLFNLFNHGNHIDRKKKIVRKTRSVGEVIRVVFF